MSSTYFIVEFLDGTHLFASNAHNMTLAELVEVWEEDRPNIYIELRDSYEVIDIDYSLIYRVTRIRSNDSIVPAWATINGDVTRFDLRDGTSKYISGNFVAFASETITVPEGIKEDDVVSAHYYPSYGPYMEWTRPEPLTVAKITLVSGRALRVQIDEDWDTWYYKLNTSQFIKLTEVAYYGEGKPTGNIHHTHTRNIETITVIKE